MGGLMHPTPDGCNNDKIKKAIYQHFVFADSFTYVLDTRLFA